MCGTPEPAKDTGEIDVLPNDAEMHLKAARDLLRERLKDYADKDYFLRVCDYANCLKMLAEVIEHGAVKDQKLPL